jgi:hypothetical protein
MQMPPQSPALRRPFARPYSVFLMDFAQYMQPTRQRIAADGFRMLSIETLDDERAARTLSCVRMGEADPLLDRDPDVLASAWAPYMAMPEDC